MGGGGAGCGVLRTGLRTLVSMGRGESGGGGGAGCGVKDWLMSGESGVVGEVGVLAVGF